MPKAKQSKATPTVAATPQGNDRYLVLDFERHYTEDDACNAIAAPVRVRKYHYQVYLLPAHAYFEGFGGSRSGLVTGKTPSLIVRESGAGMVRDTEYELADKRIWQHLIAEQLTNFSILHNNGCGPREACGFI